MHLAFGDEAVGSPKFQKSFFPRQRDGANSISARDDDIASFSCQGTFVVRGEVLVPLEDQAAELFMPADFVFEVGNFAIELREFFDQFEFLALDGWGIFRSFAICSLGSCLHKISPYCP